MIHRSSALRIPESPQLRDHVRAALVTALLPAAAAALFLWLAPRGCDIRGDVAIYRWTCLLPGLLLVVPLGVALLLPPLLIVGRRRVPPVPDGWLVTILATGAATELVFLRAYFLYLDPAYRALFLKEALLIPQPFVAGAIAAGVYWLVLSPALWRNA